METSNTVVIGAGAAGLACAMCLERRGRAPLVLEQHPHVAHAWRNHYDRLHLHTSRGMSGLPYVAMPASYPKYPSRDQVVDYLEQYAARLDNPPVFSAPVTSVERRGQAWLTSVNGAEYRSANLIVATGNTRRPVVPEFPGTAAFGGPIIHSSKYRNGRPYAGQRVLVVGFGNSACEIAICLHEHGALPALSVRSPVNIVPRDILGIPIAALGVAQSKLPAALVDAINRPLMRLIQGDIGRYGLRRAPYGTMTQIKHRQEIPLLDVGTLKLIEQGRIAVFPGIAELLPGGARFEDGRRANFDALILGTGYRARVDDFLRSPNGLLDEDGKPALSGRPTGVPGLYFCGFHVAPGGGLREIGIEAKRIAAHIVKAGYPQAG